MMAEGSVVCPSCRTRLASASSGQTRAANSQRQQTIGPGYKKASLHGQQQYNETAFPRSQRQYNPGYRQPQYQTQHSNVGVKKQTWPIIILIVVMATAIIAIASASSGGRNIKPEASPKSGAGANTAEEKTTESPVAETPIEKAPEQEDFSNIATEYTLAAGYYVAGIDIPAGVFDAEAVSGKGFIRSSNAYNGGFSEYFGIDDGSDLYTQDFKNVKFPQFAILSIDSNLIAKLTYKDIKSDFTGRIYDEASAFDLGPGNYIVGEDFPAGIYKLIANSGQGLVSTSNISYGGICEMIGVNDPEFYIDGFWNAVLEDDAELSVTGGVNIKLIPAI